MVDTVCPRVGYRRIAFHIRVCVEPLRSEEEERDVCMLVCKHLTYKYIGVPYPILWKILYVPYRPTKVTPHSKFPLVTQYHPKPRTLRYPTINPYTPHMLKPIFIIRPVETLATKLATES